MPGIQTVRIPVTTTGTAGAAVGSTTSETLIGFLLDVYLDFHATAPATTDTTIAYPQGGNILVVTSSATDVRLAPRQKLVDNANAAITNSNDRFPLNGPITVSVAECDALTDAVVAYVRVLQP